VRALVKEKAAYLSVLGAVVEYDGLLVVRVGVDGEFLPMRVPHHLHTHTMWNVGNVRLPHHGTKSE
jgi:hypothetical protein